MSELTFQKQAEYWGQAYEVLGKRGVLAHLVESGLIRRDRPGLKRWKELQLLEITKQLWLKLDIIDHAMRDVVSSRVRHLSLTAYGVGYTAMRAYVEQVRKQFKSADSLEVRALWCPLTLPGESTLEQSAREETRQAFYEEFGLHGIVDPSWSRKGQPANSDFTLWLTSPGKRDDFLLVQEYSFSMPPELLDFREQGAHLDELLRHRRIVDSRSVFARVSAEVDGEEFMLSSDIMNYLGALTSHDKPFYKLCQASSYAESTALLLQQQELLQKACTVRALAITPHGLESLAARFVPGQPAEPRCRLMGQMGKAYRETHKLADGDDSGLTEQVEKLFRGMLSKLPRRLKAGMKALQREPEVGRDYFFEFDETVPNFANPTDQFPINDAMAMVEETEELQAYFGGSARQVIGTSMRDFARGAPTLSLRDMHAAARQWLRQSLDLMTLLVMLRSTILTRITGDSDLRQKLALVPVGAVGVDELISLMSQYVAQFMREAEIFKVQGRDKELQALAGRAQGNVAEIFSRTKLHGVAKRGTDGRTLVKPDCIREFTDLVTHGLSPMLVSADTGTSLPDHVSFSGPTIVESWADFEKQEIFSFEGHATQISRATRSLMGQLKAIEEERQFPPMLRNPAANLRKLLQREQHDAANEFRTLKELKSPNTWVALPAGYFQFLHAETHDEGQRFRLDDPEQWKEALGRTLNARAAVMPPLPEYESFPWAAAVGEVNPLQLDLVFNDRYFMASNELNLLNTLLLATGDE